MAGFMVGFAQGWQAERDRIEKRKMFEQELQAKREATLLDLAARYGPSLGGTAGGSGSSGGSSAGSASLQPVAYYEDMLKSLGVEDGNIARLSSEGGATALSKVLEAIQSNNSKDHAWTPQEVNDLAKSAVIYSREGSSWDPSSLISGLGLSVDTLSPETKTALGFVTRIAPSTTVGIPYQRVNPVSLQDINTAKGMLDSALTQHLTNEQRKLSEEISQSPETTAEQAQRNEAIKTALEEISKGNIAGAMELVPPDIKMSAYSSVVANDPRLANVDFGPYWNSVKQATQAPATDTTSTDNYQVGTVLRDPKTGEQVQKMADGSWKPV